MFSFAQKNVRRVCSGHLGREVWFSNKAGARLNGLYFRSADKTRRTILVHHGMSDNMNVHNPYIAYLLNDPSTALLAYDYSGFGKSQGTASIGGLPADGLAAYDYLVSELKVAPESIVEYGASLGTGPAIALASQRPGAGLIIVSPYTSIRAAARDALPFLRYYPDWMICLDDMDSLNEIKGVKCPLLVVHGVQDTTIGVHHGDEIYAAAATPKDYIRDRHGVHSQQSSWVLDRIVKFVSAR